MLEVEKGPTFVVANATVSPVELLLRYTDFLELLRVFRDNLGRSIERADWDNLEVEWERQHGSESWMPTPESPRFSNDVTYSENARHIRYGMQKHKDGAIVQLDFRVACESFSLVIQRDDELTVNGVGAYDIVLLVVRVLRTSLSRHQDGLESASVSLGTLALFDLGLRTKLAGTGTSGNDLASRDYCVMVEGYPPSRGHGEFDSQIVFSCDRGQGSSNDWNISLLVNYLSLAPYTRPLEEIFAFFTCSFDTTQVSKTESVSHDETVGPAATEAAGAVPVQMKARSLNVKLVMHYPRFIFVAEDKQRFSRALILQGYVPPSL